MARAMTGALRNPPAPRRISALASTYTIHSIADRFVAEVMA